MLADRRDSWERDRRCWGGGGERGSDPDSALYYPRTEIVGNSLFLQFVLATLTFKDAHKLLLTQWINTTL